MSVLSDIFRCFRHIKSPFGYRKVSEWQLADDVEFDDGENLEDKASEIMTLFDDASDEFQKIQDAIKDMTDRVTDSKGDLSDVISGGGIDVSGNATFDELADAIRRLIEYQYKLGYSDAMVGTASPAEVLEEYTFTNSEGVGLSGSMPNNGVLNWTPTGSQTYTVSAGYYSGGTLNSGTAYDNGYGNGYDDGQENAKPKETIHWSGTVFDYNGTFTVDISIPGMLSYSTLNVTFDRYRGFLDVADSNGNTTRIAGNTNDVTVNISDYSSYSSFMIGKQWNSEDDDEEWWINFNAYLNP